ncbi:MAG: hypothetical protein ACR2HT_02300, partial [Pyrinomonadaceae bacterium]
PIFYRGVNAISVYDFRTSTYEKMSDSGSSPVWLNDSRHFIYSSGRSAFICDSETKKSLKFSNFPLMKFKVSMFQPITECFTFAICRLMLTSG